MLIMIYGSCIEITCDVGYNEVFISIQTDEYGNETLRSLLAMKD